MLQAGSSIPTLDVTHLDGAPVGAEEVLTPGSPVLLVLFKAGCPTCQLTLPFFNRLGGHLRVMGISQDEGKATERFRDAYGIQYMLLLDEKRKGYPTSNGFGITNVPALFLVDGGGQIEWSDTGFSKRALTGLAARFGVDLFEPSDRVPEFKPG